MADKKLDKRVEEATKAYQKKDKRKGAQILDEVLRKDINHPGAWALLYQLFGNGRDFTEFQRAFALQYYPDRLAELRPGEIVLPVSAPAVAPLSSAATGFTPAEPEQPEKRSFLSRLFGRGKDKKHAAAPMVPPKSAETPSAVRRRTMPGAAPAPSRPISSVIPAGPPAAPPAATPAPPPAGMPAPSLLASRPPLQPSPVPPSVLSSNLSNAAPKPVSDKKIHVVVVDDIPQTRETLIRTLRFQENIEVDGTATNGLQAIELVKEVRPDVVIMDVNMPDMDGITATRYIKQQVPSTQIIILTVQDDVDYIRQAMNAGARDFLAKPPMIEDLMTAVQRAAEFARRERENAAPPVTKSGVTTGLAATTTASLAGRGRIISVYSPRGGCGCTTLACNLAAALYTPENRVGVVDGQLQYGDVAVYFNLQAKNDIIDLAPHVAELDPELVEEVMASHTSGIKVLPASRPERAELVTGPQFSQLLSYLSTVYAYVIVDTSHRLNDVTLAALDVSDLVALVATQDIPAISRMRKFLDLAPQLNLNSKKLLMVMNQYDQRINIGPENLGQAFNQPVMAVIPAANDIALNAANRGEPFMFNKDLANRPIGRGVQSMIEAMLKRLTEIEKEALTMNPGR